MILETFHQTSTIGLRSSLRASLATALLSITLHAAAGQSPSAPDKFEQNAAPPTATAPSADAPATKPIPLTPWQVLTAGASTHNSQHRAEAVAALGTIGPNRRVVTLIEKALEDKDSSIRQLAERTLGEIQARSAIPKLRKALSDDSPEVCFAAAKSLWNMGDRSGRDVFIQILSGERSSSEGLVKGGLESTKKQFQDPKKLAFIGAKEAASSLFGPAGWGIKVMEEISHDRSSSARAMSAILLGGDATLDALHELQDALTDKNWIVRAAAAQALGASRHRDQVQFLRPLLDDDKPAVRYMAAASILRLSSGEVRTRGEKATALKLDARPALGPKGPRTSE